MRKELNSIGMPLVKLSPMGRDKVLIHFGSCEQKELWIKSGALQKWFQVTHEWSYRICNQSRWAWLAVEGVPLHAWCEDTFRRIANHWGNVVSVHSSTSNREDLDKGLILVDIPLNMQMDQSALLKVGDFLYKIRISEINLHDNDAWNFIKEGEDGIGQATGSISGGGQASGNISGGDCSVGGMENQPSADVGIMSQVEDTFEDMCPQNAESLKDVSASKKVGLDVSGGRMPKVSHIFENLNRCLGVVSGVDNPQLSAMGNLNV